ncbi:MAG: peptidylprolyl isomerase [Dehalococcoidia bacterium]|nr:peptidylprolyl isomerase [Dehalococcoidia bacterium]
MTRKKVEKPTREMTKRQRSRWQEQLRRQRIAFISGIAIIVIVIAVLVTGWYVDLYRPLRQVVLRVNDKEFTTEYYIDMLKFYGRGQTQYISAIADQVVETIKEAELIRQGALKLGIAVTDADVDKRLAELNLGKEFRDPVRMSLLTTALKDTYFEQLVPEFGEHRQIMAMLLEDEARANEVKAGLEKGEIFADLASQLSLENYTRTNKGDLGWRPKGILPTLLNSTVLENKVFSTPAGTTGTLYDPEQTKSVGYVIAKMLDRQEPSVRAQLQVIIVGTKDEADKVKARLNAGEDFAALAKEFSLLGGAKENGGLVGWVTPGTWSKQVDEFLFNPQTKQFAVSNPIRDETMTTKGSSWLFKVQAVENRKIEGESRDTLKQKLLSDWVKGLSNDPNNKFENLLNPSIRAFAVTMATKK